MKCVQNAKEVRNETIPYLFCLLTEQMTCSSFVFLLEKMQKSLKACKNNANEEAADSSVYTDPL